MNPLIKMLMLFSLLLFGCTTEQAVVRPEKPTQAKQQKETEPGSFSSHFPEWLR